MSWSFWGSKRILRWPEWNVSTSLAARMVFSLGQWNMIRGSCSLSFAAHPNREHLRLPFCLFFKKTMIYAFPLCPHVRSFQSSLILKGTGKDEHLWEQLLIAFRLSSRKLEAHFLATWWYLIRWRLVWGVTRRSNMETQQRRPLRSVTCSLQAWSDQIDRERACAFALRDSLGRSAACCIANCKFGRFRIMEPAMCDFFRSCKWRKAVMENGLSPA